MNLAGWDVVSARSLASINEALARLTKELPAVVELSRGTLSFGPWQIVGRSGARATTGGGSDELLDVDLPIASGLWRQGSTPLDLAGAVVRIEIQLSLLDDVPGAGVRDLRFRLDAVGKAPAEATDGAVIVKSIVPPLGKTIPPVLLREIGDEIPERLITQREKLAFVLARLSLAPTGDAAWLRFRHTHAYFAAGSATGTAYLVLLGTLETRGGDRPQPVIDPALLDGSELCLALDAGVFLEHLLLPHLAPAHGVAPDTFAVQAGVVVNRRPFPSGDPEDKVRVDEYRLRVVDEKLESVASGRCDNPGTRPGEWMSFHVIARSALRCKGQALELVPDPHPDVQSQVHATAKSRLKRAWSFIKSVGMSEIVGPMMENIVDGMFKSLGLEAGPTGLSAIRYGELGRQAFQWTEQSFAWIGATNLETRSAGLSDAFYLRAARPAAPAQGNLADAIRLFSRVLS